jgi:phage-related minor tail protein
MAGGIKGITVEIGGDTTKLGKAIDDTEKKSRSLQVELRQVEKLLKFDPTNVELLSQKQELLTQNVAETSKKLDLLKEAEKQVTEQFKKGEASEEQVRALQREIIKTEGVLGSMKSELTSTEKALKDLADGTDNAKKHTKEYAESVEKAKKDLDEFKGKASDAFDTLKTGAVAAGAAVVATAGYALKLSTDFDKATNTLITKTGASADEIDDLNTAMENVYANNFGESIEDVANAMATVRTNTKLTGEELEKTTEYALLMHDTFDFEVNESTRSAKMLMDQYGISAKEAYNLIAQGAQNGLDKNGDLLDTINEYAVHFNSLGIDAEGMFNMLVNGAENGTFSVDKLGDAVKEFGIRAKDGSKTTTEAFIALGLDVDATSAKFAQGGESANEALNEVMTALFAMEDPLAQNTAGVNLFGTMWEDLGADAIKSLMSVEGEISIAKNALDDINNTKYDDIGSALQGLGRTIETDVVKPLGEELKPVVEEAIETVKANAPQIKDILTNVVKKIGEFIGFIVNNGDVIVSTIGAIGAGFVTWKVVSLVSGVVSAIQAFKVANEGATIAQWAMNAAMNANPIGIVITAIAALVAAFILLWNNCEEFRNFWINLWEGIKTAAKAVADWFSQTWTTVTDWFKNTWLSISTWFKNLWDGIYTNVIQPIAQWFLDLWNGIVNAFHTVIDPWIEIIRRASILVYNEIIKPIADYFVGLWNNIVSGVSSAINTVKSVFSTVANWVNTTVIQPITGFFSTLWNGFKTGATNAWEGVKSVFSTVGTFFGSVFNTVKDKILSVFSAGGKIFLGIKDGIVSTFKSVVNVIIEGINKVISVPFNGLNDILNRISGLKILGVSPFSWLTWRAPIPQIPLLARGGIVTRPTLAGIGEDGAEAIIPLERNTEFLDKVAQRLNQNIAPANSVEVLTALDRIYDRLNRLQVVLNNGVLVGEILDDIDARLADKQLLNARGV